jgi:hypothetical protein
MAEKWKHRDVPLAPRWGPLAKLQSCKVAEAQKVSEHLVLFIVQKMVAKSTYVRHGQAGCV